MKVSIIIPVYNVYNYLKECLESVERQSLKEKEIIIVNDGSTDDSYKIIKEYEEKYKDIKSYIKSNGGLSDARNYGLERCIGEYILFLDSDDYLIDNNALQNLYDIAKLRELDILKFNYFDERTNKIKFNYSIENPISGQDFLKILIPKKEYISVAWNALYKKEYIEKFKFRFAKGRLHEDERWTPEAILKSKKIMQIDNSYIFYRLNLSSITSKKDRNKNAQDIIKTCYELEEIYNNIYDDTLKKLLMDNLANKYLYAFTMGNLYENEKNNIIDKKFLRKKGYYIKSNIKIYIFMLNYKLYHYLNNICWKYKNKRKRR